MDNSRKTEGQQAVSLEKNSSNLSSTSSFALYPKIGITKRQDA